MKEVLFLQEINMAPKAIPACIPLHALKVRGCGERNKTPGKRRKRVEKVCTIKR